MIKKPQMPILFRRSVASFSPPSYESERVTHKRTGLIAGRRRRSIKELARVIKCGGRAILIFAGCQTTSSCLALVCGRLSVEARGAIFTVPCSMTLARVETNALAIK